MNFYSHNHSHGCDFSLGWSSHHQLMCVYHLEEIHLSTYSVWEMPFRTCSGHLVRIYLNLPVLKMWTNQCWSFKRTIMFVFSSCRYESPEIALNCGIMLRECIRHEPLAKIILWSEQFYDFFRYVEMSTFDIASDAFATFKVTYKKYRILNILASQINRCAVFPKSLAS